MDSLTKSTGIILFSLLSVFWCTGPSGSSEYDLLIVNGNIVDGTGNPVYQADILVRDGIIVEIGELNPEEVRAGKVIDASGKVVAPGFIDPHAHGNPLETRFDNFLAMGVTTISLGQDGSSPQTRDVPAWMDEVDALGTGPNIVHFTGHGTLRRLTDAPPQSGLKQEYIDEMVKLMSASMEAGSFGMTTGLEYIPGGYAALPELIALAEPVAEYGGVVMSHLRSEDDDKIGESVTELIEQGRGSGAKVHVSHLKIVYADDPQRAGEVLDLLNRARKEGIQVTADVYPYTASFTGIGIVFPDWAKSGSYDEIREKRRGELAAYLRDRVNARNGPGATLFGTAPWAGMTLAEVADSLDKPFEEVLMDDIGPRGASAAYFVMDEGVMRRFLQDPRVMISSDGSPGMRHPRSYGSFAKVIRRYVNEEGVLSLEEAVYKMSGLSARTLGLSDSTVVNTPRGLIREGFAADLLVFDPDRVRDKSTFENPHQYAEGFDWMFVNGTAVIEEGQLNKKRPSGVIRKRRDRR